MLKLFIAKKIKSMSKLAAKVAIVSALILAPMSLPALSQTAAPGTTETAPGMSGTTTTTDNRDYNNEGKNGYWGLLGLLGLFGLMGRKSSRNEYTTGTAAYRDPADVPGTGTRDRY